VFGQILAGLGAALGDALTANGVVPAGLFDEPGNRRFEFSRPGPWLKLKRRKAATFQLPSMRLQSRANLGLFVTCLLGGNPMRVWH
jgi:hypothetical protein